MKKITAEFLANTKIRVTPEQSAKVQELAFSLGYAWGGNGCTTLRFQDAPYLFFSTKFIYYHDELDNFSHDERREITYADLFPEAEEPITPEALEKEPGWSYRDLLKDYYNGIVVVEFYTSGGFEVLIDGDLERATAKGTDTMPKLRLLTELINGKP